MPLAASSLTNPTLATGGGGSWFSQPGVDLNRIGNYTDTIVLENQNTASVQITAETGTYSAFVGALRGSIDGIVWENVSGKTALGMGINAGVADVTLYKFLRVEVTTANGAALVARVSIALKTI